MKSAIFSLDLLAKQFLVFAWHKIQRAFRAELGEEARCSIFSPRALLAKPNPLTDCAGI